MRISADVARVLGLALGIGLRLGLGSGPLRGWGSGVSYPGTRDVWGAPPSARNLKSTRECIILKRKIHFLPMKMFGGPAKMSPLACCGSRQAWSGLGLEIGLGDG